MTENQIEVNQEHRGNRSRGAGLLSLRSTSVSDVARQDTSKGTVHTRIRVKEQGSK